MVSKNGMTIRDYLARRALSKDFLKQWQTAIKGSRDGSGPFARLLQSSLSHCVQKANRASTGLTAVDYLANPISARAPVTTSISAINRNSQPSPVGDSNDKNSGTHDETNVKETIEKCIQEAAQKYRLAPGLIKAVISAESGFRVDAVSVAGAEGLMQLMPATAKGLGVTNPFDIRQNIDGGVRYLRQMFDLFDGDARLALSAYNAGPGNVQKYGGDVPFPETRRYVARVLASVRDFT